MFHNIQVQKIGSNLCPLSYLPNGNLLAYQSGKILILNGSNAIIDKFNLFRNFKEKFISKCNVLNRLLRLGIRSSLVISDNTIILSIKNCLYEYNWNQHLITKGFILPKGIRPLKITQVSHIKGFDDMIIFGEYSINMNKAPVNIYKRISQDKWEPIFTFKQGLINHIHNIVPDKWNECLWVFTGDFENAAAIWKVTDNFGKVECIFKGKQKYRACVAYATEKGVVYATDTPFEKNYIHLLSLKKSGYHIENISEIKGSCIYGCNAGNQYLFSTTVESNGLNENLFQILFSRKRGKGIEDEYAHLYAGNIEKGFQEIYKLKKDIYPFICQFAVFKFPEGDNPNNEIYIYPVATEKYDLCLLEIDAH